MTYHTCCAGDAEVSGGSASRSGHVCSLDPGRREVMRPSAGSKWRRHSNMTLTIRGRGWQCAPFAPDMRTHMVDCSSELSGVDMSAPTLLRHMQ